MSVIENPQKSFRKKDYNKTKSEQKNFKNKNELIKNVIDECIKVSKNFDQFLEEMSKRGFEKIQKERL